MLELLILVPFNMNKLSNGYEVLYLQQWCSSTLGARWRVAMAAAAVDGGGRRQRAAVGDGSGRRLVAETGPKQRKQRRENRAAGGNGHGWRQWRWSEARLVATCGRPSVEARRSWARERGRKQERGGPHGSGSRGSKGKKIFLGLFLV